MSVMAIKRNLYLWQFAGFVITVLGGTLLHFSYGLTNESVLVAPFSAVNESTWEHMKLMYFPLFVFALIQSRFFREYKSFWCIKLIGIITGIMLIPVLFYTYNGAFGKSPDWLNMTIFFFTAAIVFILETLLFKKDSLHCKKPWISFLVICVIGALFVLFTFVTPKIPLFQNPLTGLYGVKTFPVNFDLNLNNL